MHTPTCLVVGKVRFHKVFAYSDSLSKNGNCRIEASRGKTIKRLISWKGKLLSLGGKLIFINLVLTNIVLHMISFFLLPKGDLDKLDYYWYIFRCKF
jgi:hypothetical protein